MRLDYRIELENVEIPRFSVEAVEGIGKLFTLATLVLNVLDSKQEVEVVFHGLNPEDPGRKIDAFQNILCSSDTIGPVTFRTGSAGRVPGSSSYFQWLGVVRD